MRLPKLLLVETSGQTFNSYSDVKPDDTTLSPRETIFSSTGDHAVFTAGQMGFIYGATWDASSYATDIGDTLSYDFVGLPDGKVLGTADYYGISKTATDKAAAYEVTKYLTFGAQGISDTFGIISAAKTDEDITFTMPGLPMNETQSIIDQWFTTYPQPGFKQAYEKAASGDVQVLMEGNKYVPGYTSARFNYDTGIDAQLTRPNNAAGSTLPIGDFIYDASLGKINYSNYMTSQLAFNINIEFHNAQVALDNK